MKIRGTMLLMAVVAVCVGCSLPVKESKRAVCHQGETIYVDAAEVAAHIRHGDYGRACYGESKESTTGTPK